MDSLAHYLTPLRSSAMVFKSRRAGHGAYVWYAAATLFVAAAHAHADPLGVVRPPAEPCFASERALIAGAAIGAAASGVAWTAAYPSKSRRFEFGRDGFDTDSSTSDRNYVPLLVGGGSAVLLGTTYLALPSTSPAAGACESSAVSSWGLGLVGGGVGALGVSLLATLTTVDRQSAEFYDAANRPFADSSYSAVNVMPLAIGSALTGAMLIAGGILLRTTSSNAVMVTPSPNGRGGAILLNF